MKLRVLTLLTAALFGALGAALRVFTENDLLSDFSSEAALILINVVGSACLGAITVYCEERPASCLNFLLNKGVGTGLLGSFTTFSALSLLCLNHDFVSGTCYMAQHSFPTRRSSDLCCRTPTTEPARSTKSEE